MGVTTLRGPLALTSLLALLTAFPRRAGADRCERIACRCVPASVLGLTDEELVRRRLGHAERVVLGRVVRIDTLAPHMEGHGPDQVSVSPVATRITVSRVWKGPAVDTLTVVVGNTAIESSCDLRLEPGESYVIFASRGENGLLFTSQCTGTASEHDATATISALGPAQELRR